MKHYICIYCTLASLIFFRGLIEDFVKGVHKLNLDYLSLLKKQVFSVEFSCRFSAEFAFVDLGNFARNLLVVGCSRFLLKKKFTLL